MSDKERPSGWVPVSVVARYLGVHVRTVTRWAEEERIPRHHQRRTLGRHLRVCSVWLGKKIQDESGQT